MAIHELSLDTKEVQTATDFHLLFGNQDMQAHAIRKPLQTGRYDLSIDNTYPDICAEDKDGAAELTELQMRVFPGVLIPKVLVLEQVATLSGG